MAQLFGFEIVRKKEAEEKAQPDRLVTFAPEIKDDGAVVVAEGGVFGTYLDLEGSARTESTIGNEWLGSRLSNPMNCEHDRCWQEPRTLLSMGLGHKLHLNQESDFRP